MITFPHCSDYSGMWWFVVCHAAFFSDKGLRSERQGQQEVSRTQPQSKRRQNISAARRKPEVPSELRRA